MLKFFIILLFVQPCFVAASEFETIEFKDGVSIERGDTEFDYYLEVSETHREGEVEELVRNISAEIGTLNQKKAVVYKSLRELPDSGAGVSAMGFITYTTRFGLSKDVVGENDFIIKVVINGNKQWHYIPFGLLYEGGVKQFGKDVVFGHKVKLKTPMVWYDIGAMDVASKVIIGVSNEFDTRVQLKMYKSGAKIGESALQWGVWECRSHVRIFDGQAIISGKCMSVGLDENGYWRTDTHKMWRNVEDTMAKHGQVEIKIGDQVKKIIVPISLLRYTQGCVKRSN